MAEGYGMTETGFTSLNDEGDNTSGHVGSPTPGSGNFSFFEHLQLEIM